MMTVEEKPDVTYNDVGGCKEQIEKMREVSGMFLLFYCWSVLLVGSQMPRNMKVFNMGSNVDTSYGVCKCSADLLTSVLGC